MHRNLYNIMFSIFGLIAFTLLSLSLVCDTPVSKKVLSHMTGHETVESISGKLKRDVHIRLKSQFDRLGLGDFPDELVMAAFKEEQQLTVYANTEHGLKQLKTYTFTATSGELGPKLQEGDKQIPEGIYQIEFLNPNSNYHLSLKISYPNQFDIAKSRFDNVNQMGGDIFIHGKNVTIGCIPIGDTAVEEVFILASESRKPIKLIISPRDFRNHPEEPKIQQIDWEGELYALIKEALKGLPDEETTTRS